MVDAEHPSLGVCVFQSYGANLACGNGVSLLEYASIYSVRTLEIGIRRCKAFDDAELQSDARMIGTFEEDGENTGRTSIMKSPQLVASSPGLHTETGYASAAL